MPPTPQQIADALLQELSERGQIVEGGWRAFERLSLEGASEVQRREMRKAFFFGAQHVFASVIRVLDPGDEPTDKDLRVMTLLDKELQAFLEPYKRESGIPH